MNSLPIELAAALLLVSGMWYTALIFLSIHWNRHYETPSRLKERIQEERNSQNRFSDVFDAVMLCVPAAITLGLAIDGLTNARFIFHATGWSWSLPAGGIFQAVGTLLVFIGLPLFTWTVYVIQRYVYAKVQSERVLIQRGPYARIRHPMHSAAFLLAIGWVLLAQNFLALVLLFMLQGVIVARKEETELIEAYGDEYSDYMRRTGFFFPRLGKTS